MLVIEKICLGKTLTARAAFSGKDLWVLVTGGDQAHIGSLSLGLPRLSLTGNGAERATVSTFNITGHKDDFVGNLFADSLASSFRCVASVSCGIHFDGLLPESHSQIMAAAEDLLAELIELLGSAKDFYENGDSGDQVNNSPA